MSIKETYDLIQQNAASRGLISQKELLSRWGLTVRAVQRTRKKYGLEPVAFYGVNPLFTEQDIQRVEAAVLEDRRRMIARKSQRGQKNGIVSMAELRKAKGKARK